jgi:hypothetical protein
LLRIIDDRMQDSSTDPETRTRLQRLRSAVVEIGKDTATGLLTAYLQNVIPLRAGG